MKSGGTEEFYKMFLETFKKKSQTFWNATEINLLWEPKKNDHNQMSNLTHLIIILLIEQDKVNAVLSSDVILFWNCTIILTKNIPMLRLSA